jgi:hypothetical protein
MGLTVQPTLQTKNSSRACTSEIKKIAVAWSSIIVRVGSLAWIIALLFLCADSVGGHLTLRQEIGAACLIFAAVVFVAARIFERTTSVRLYRRAHNSSHEVQNSAEGPTRNSDYNFPLDVNR